MSNSLLGSLMAVYRQPKRLTLTKINFSYSNLLFDTGHGQIKTLSFNY